MFWEIFYALCESKNMKPLQVVKELGISAGSTTKWKNGSVPSGKTLQKLADFFGVSVDYLLGKTDQIEKPSVTEDEELAKYLEFLRTDENYRMMFSLMNGASKEDVEKAVKMVKAFLGED